MTQITNREKIEMLKDTITHLYCKEGRNKSYIARLLNVDRVKLTAIINHEWKLEQAHKRHVTPSTQKFLNKHRALIKARLDKDCTIKEIAKELSVKPDFLSRTCIANDPLLSQAKEEYNRRIHKNTSIRRQELKSKSSYQYDPVDLEGEQWKAILGYPNYYVSNKGRIKSYVSSYDSYKLLTVFPNKNNGRMYVWIGDKGLQVARLVGFAFVDGYSEKNCTIEHIDNNVANNCANNLMWVSQAENNLLAYKKKRKPAIAHSKYPKTKLIIVDDKYEFKTIRAFAKFINKSETQAQRYIDGSVTNNPYKIKVVY